ncbi:hypothetical protein [Jeotgalibacillus sp. JSM ZJ347]|uniref:hypothetical protein n=1 Tax=Jeotgalibacillus sp. JSM ZJ347 TaxID=3342117 RepID=UPI0035A8671F
MNSIRLHNTPGKHLNITSGDTLNHSLDLNVPGKTIESENELETTLIELGHDDFINLGRAGRAWVINRAEDESQIDALIATLIKTISNVLCAENVEEAERQLRVLGIPVEYKNTLTMLTENNHAVTTLTQLKKLIAEYEAQSAAPQASPTVEID